MKAEKVKAGVAVIVKKWKEKKSTDFAYLSGVRVGDIGVIIVDSFTKEVDTNIPTVYFGKRGYHLMHRMELKKV